jgi:hypothetical protein
VAWARASADGKPVTVDIAVNYDGDETRPSSFSVQYSIDGQQYDRFFVNGP